MSDTLRMKNKLIKNFEFLLPFHSVKPAVFDLFLTIAIIAYLGAVYLIVHNFSHVYNLATRLSSKSKTS